MLRRAPSVVAYLRAPRSPPQFIFMNGENSMYLKSIRQMVLALNLGLVTTAFGVSAQAEDPPLETLVVSAAREAVPVEKVGSALSVIDEQTLARRQLTSVGEMLRSLPGIAVSRSGGLGSQSQLRVRGSEANHVLVLIDGIPVNDVSQGSEFNVAHLFNDQLTQIEFLRGPQSSLWGSDALAGVISIESSKPTDGLQLGGVIEGGSDEYYHAGANLGWANDRGYVRLGTRTLSTDGHNISRTGREQDGYENTSSTFRAGLDVTETLAIDTSWHYVDSTTDFDSTDFATGFPVDRNDETQAEQLYGRINASLGLFEDRWRQQLSINLTDTDNANRVENIFGPNAFSRSSTASESVQYVYQSHFDLGDVHTLSLAIEHETHDFRQRGEASFFGDPNRDEEIQSTSYAVEYRGNLVDSFYWQASVRHDANDDFDDATTWRLNGIWWLTDASKIRGGVGTGVKNPTFSERFGFFTNFVGNPDLEPEHSESWEVGIDQRISAALNISLTYFQTELNDEINGFVFLPTLGAFTAANDAGESDREGIELSVAWALSEMLDLSAAYTWLDATENGFTGEIDEVRRPRSTASLEIAWQPSDRWSVSLRGDHNGSQDDVFFPPVPPFQQTVTLDGFTLVTLAAQFQATDWLNVYARVENALDEDYEEVFGFQTPGRALVFGLRFNTQ